MKQNKYWMLQFKLASLNVQRCHAEIVSGAYKLLDVRKMIAPGQYEKYSDDAKLKFKLQEMNRHIQAAEDIANKFTTEEKDLKNEQE